MRRGSRLCCIFYDQCGSCWASNSCKLCVYSYFRSKHSLTLRNVRVDAVNIEHGFALNLTKQAPRRMFCRLIWGHRKNDLWATVLLIFVFESKQGFIVGTLLLSFSRHAVPCYYYTNFSQLNVWMPAVGITECMQRNSPVKGSKTPALTYTTAKRKRTKALVSLLTCCNFSLCSDLKLVQPSYFFFFSFLSVFQLHKDTEMKH